MDGGAWLATVHGVEKSWTRLSNFTIYLLPPVTSGAVPFIDIAGILFCIRFVENNGELR